VGTEVRSIFSGKPQNNELKKENDQIGGGYISRDIEIKDCGLRPGENYLRNY
jgi:hypothetical protein